MWSGFDAFKQKDLKRQFDEDSKKIEAADFEAPYWFNWPTMTCFILKPIVVLAGFGHLLVSML
ncbi:hypothetical protein AB4571_03870 [Vibrio breoganii]|nr:hypothetical protein [Vibrio breoganii]